MTLRPVVSIVCDMNRKFGVIGLFLVTAALHASPIINVSGGGNASHGLFAETNLQSFSSANSVHQSSSTSFYSGTGDYVYLNDYWTTSHDGITGYDENGDPIYGPVTEDQSATAEAQAYAYSRFESSNNGHGYDLITAEVYAYATSSTSAYGSEAYANAYAGSASDISISFDISALSDVLLSSTVAYGDAYLALYHQGNLVSDTNMLAHNPEGLYLQPGSYTLQGTAGSGGAEFSVLATAAPVPEPLSIAALGMGILLLRRRTR